MYPGHTIPQSKQISCSQATVLQNHALVMFPGHRYPESSLSHVARPQGSRIKAQSCCQATSFQNQTFLMFPGPRGDTHSLASHNIILQWPELPAQRWAYELLKTNEQQRTIFYIVGRRACILSLDYLNFQLLGNPLWSETIKPVPQKSELWNLEKLSSDDIHPLKKAVPDFLNF